MAQSQFEHLSKKSLIIYISGMISPAAFLLLLTIAIIAFRSKFPDEVQSYLSMAVFLGSALFIVTGAGACLAGYLKYATYKFALDEDALRIERGILSREIIAIPYRQIQNINIDRNITNRLWGLSNLIITTAAHEEKDDEGDKIEAEGVLPFLDVDRAEEIQAELLKRTNVEKVIEVNQNLSK